MTVEPNCKCKPSGDVFHDNEKSCLGVGDLKKQFPTFQLEGKLFLRKGVLT